MASFAVLLLFICVKTLWPFAVRTAFAMSVGSTWSREVSPAYGAAIRYSLAVYDMSIAFPDTWLYTDSVWNRNLLDLPPFSLYFVVSYELSPIY